MIPFDISEVHVEHVRLKSVTTALGGSISIVDTKRSTSDREFYTKVRIPMAVARAFIKLHEVRNYLKPVLTAVTFYGNHAVALERHPLGSAGQEITEGLFGERLWVSQSEQNLDGFLMPLTMTGDWYTDGTHVFEVHQHDIDEATHLTRDGRFRAVEVQSVKFAKMPDFADGIKEYRTCLQFVASTGQKVMTSPIWKQLDTVGGRQINRVDGDDEDVGIATDRFQFDRVDQYLSVNLAFTLKAAREVSKLFGYDAIEPLSLDRLMIQLRTVNLPNIPKAIKQTFDTGLPFTHAVAWLIGLTARTETLESYMVLRSLLKYLTTKGIYRKDAFTPSSVYKDGKAAEDVQLMTLDEAQNAKMELSVHDIHLMNTTITRRRQRGLGVGAAGGLYDAD